MATSNRVVRPSTSRTGWPRNKGIPQSPPTAQAQFLSAGQLTVDRIISLYVTFEGGWITIIIYYYV